ncbi:hypothetical protein [Kineosporia sp. NBRC 101731]|uniref:hypothetical protein n=1 Tax=Kineosporia sp. NBRC 101731 TaxID=3032199 RepID=UPI0024A0570C|nr:hypothetical protein [Kineosporia sp. NBRC 101731]GLY28036.1 hypothetical protein Kisp02_14010 [Kineosporia sp. NBRC 101731]
MNTVTQTPDLANYLAAVRRELGDLGTDEVDELTGGLEADLADALDGSDRTPEGMFGPPQAYAAELRAAAGLSPRGAKKPPRLSIRPRIAAAEAWLDRQPWGPGVKGFGETARPLWWAFRSYVVYQLIVQTLSDTRQRAPESEVQWLLLIVLVIGGIELERRKWFSSGRFRRGLVGAADLLAVGSLVLAAWLFVIPNYSVVGLVPVGTDGYTDSFSAAQSDPIEGVTNGGRLVHNIFPYDSEGNPLQGVQLFDDQGRMLVPSEKDYLEGGSDVSVNPAKGRDGRNLFNVYPLKETLTGWDENGNEIPVRVRDAKAPSRLQYPVSQGEPEPTGTATPGPTPTLAPTLTPTPALTETAEPTSSEPGDPSPSAELTEAPADGDEG